MRLVALKSIKLKTPGGYVELKVGDTFIPKDPEQVISAGIAEPITQRHFKALFDKVAAYLRQRNFTEGEMIVLKVLTESLDKAWNELNYPEFKKLAVKISSFAGELKPEGIKPIAARIYSKVLQAEVWVCNSPEALSFVPEGEVVYLPEEIQGLRGASPEDIQAIYMVKKELHGILIMASNRKEELN